MRYVHNFSHLKKFNNEAMVLSNGFHGSAWEVYEFMQPYLIKHITLLALFISARRFCFMLGEKNGNVWAGGNANLPTDRMSWKLQKNRMCWFGSKFYIFTRIKLSPSIALNGIKFFCLSQKRPVACLLSFSFLVP